VNDPILPEPEPPPNLPPTIAAVINKIARELTYNTNLQTTLVQHIAVSPQTPLPQKNTVSNTIHSDSTHTTANIDVTHQLPSPPCHNATTCAVLLKVAGSIPHTPTQPYLYTLRVVQTVQSQTIALYYYTCNIFDPTICPAQDRPIVSNAWLWVTSPGKHPMDALYW